MWTMLVVKEKRKKKRKKIADTVSAWLVLEAPADFSQYRDPQAFHQN